MRENDEVSNPVIVNCKLKIKFKEAKCLKKTHYSVLFEIEVWRILNYLATYIPP